MVLYAHHKKGSPWKLPGCNGWLLFSSSRVYWPSTSCSTSVRHEPTVKEAAIWSSIYISIALLFGLYIFVTNGPSAATEFYAGYITEEALSVDNLFVFMIIMGTFRVTRENQQKVLLSVSSLRSWRGGSFIFAGAAIINSFAWVFLHLRPDPAHDRR